ncbi:hypothetical protein D047_4635B, partial [Vibrio parahaemolyticus VPTS-2010_2]
STCTALEYV